MKFIYFLIFFMPYLFQVGAQSQPCVKENKLYGEISQSHNSQNTIIYCWKIEVPKDSYIRLDFKELDLHDFICSDVYVEISVAVTGEVQKFCPTHRNWNTITALNEVTIRSSLAGFNDRRRTPSFFKLVYNIESIMCTQKSHFRCSEHLCIHQNQVCDGVEDCEDGVDEVGCETTVTSIEGVKDSLKYAIAKLKSERLASYGWGRNTHRAVTALYLAGDAHFRGDDLTEELMAKQLELQTAVALLKNYADPLSVSDMSMYVSALSATCYDPRHFYGYDLVQILGDRVALSKFPCPGSYLTLCNSNWTFSETHVRSLLNLLHGSSEYPFMIDIQAMAIMALTCVKSKTVVFEDVANATEIYNRAIQNFINSQQPDGSFGNVYRTALVAQALLSAGQENYLWDVRSTVEYLKKQLTTSTDFLTAYLILPIFNSKTLVDLANIKCNGTRRKHENDEIADVTDKPGEKTEIQYSLYIGDLRDVVHTIYLRVPINSSAFDVMRVAQMADHKYKFLYNQMEDYLYVYEIAGIKNDAEALQFWLLHTENFKNDEELRHNTKSPDELVLNHGEHLIMWYKTVYV